MDIEGSFNQCRQLVSHMMLSGDSNGIIQLDIQILEDEFFDFNGFSIAIKLTFCQPARLTASPVSTI